MIKSPDLDGMKGALARCDASERNLWAARFSNIETYADKNYSYIVYLYIVVDLGAAVGLESPSCQCRC
jgi:hypothetical protein